MVVATARLRVLFAVLAPFKVAGENTAVTPAGKPVTKRAIVELNPFCGVVATES